MRINRIAVGENISLDQSLDMLPLEPVFKKYKNKHGSLIPLLQAAQTHFGYLPGQVFQMIADETGIPVADIYGVATFYAQFRLKPVGKNIIKVCHGTACHVQNANSITEAMRDELHLKDGETTPDGLFTLESVACLGCCSLAPVMMIGDNTYGKLNGKSAVKIVREIKMNASVGKQ
jgi:NADH-quinone oxidoreductase subunit E